MHDTRDTFQYLTISAEGIGEFKDRGSKFIGYAYHAPSTDVVEACIETLKKEHLKARHHCYAYILDRHEQQFRANDDGEPSGTGGKPILGQIKSANLKEVLVVVVRYFGGTKLGTSGLINAYKTAAQLAIEDAEITEVTLQNKYTLFVDYGEMGHVLNILKTLDIEIIDKNFTDIAVIDIAINCTEADEMLTNFKARLLDISTDMVDEETQVDYCKIDLIEGYE